MAGIKKELRVLGPECKKYRQLADLSQREVARRLGYESAQIISNFERGLCGLPPKNLFEYGRICGIPESVILGISLSEFLYSMAEELSPGSIKGLC